MDVYHLILKEENHYYAPFRQPLKGYRKTLDCDNIIPIVVFLPQKFIRILIVIHVSNYVVPILTLLYQLVINQMLLHLELIPEYLPETGRPLIRSGMQPNSSGQQN